MFSGAHIACVDQAVKALTVVHDYITTGMETTLDITDDLLEQGQEGQQSRVDELKQIMREYTEMDRDMQNFITATKHVIKEGKSKQIVELENLLGMLDDKVNQLGNDSDKHYKNDKYKEFLEKIKGFENQGHVDDDDEEMLEDVAVTQQEVNTKCPYTGQEMTNPVKNKLCGHSYDRDGIMALIKNRKGRAKCPLPGCINDKAISVGDLVENRALKRYIERKNRELKKK